MSKKYLNYQTQFSAGGTAQYPDYFTAVLAARVDILDLLGGRAGKSRAVKEIFWLNVVGVGYFVVINGWNELFCGYRLLGQIKIK